MGWWRDKRTGQKQNIGENRKIMAMKNSERKGRIGSISRHLLVWDGETDKEGNIT